jgi:hypothetical protein
MPPTSAAGRSAFASLVNGFGASSTRIVSQTGPGAEPCSCPHAMAHTQSAAHATARVFRRMFIARHRCRGRGDARRPDPSAGNCSGIACVAARVVQERRTVRRLVAQICAAVVRCVSARRLRRSSATHFCDTVPQRGKAAQFPVRNLRVRARSAVLRRTNALHFRKTILRRNSAPHFRTAP